MKLRPPKHQTLLFDLESDGLLHQLTRIHVLSVREFETGNRWTFRQNAEEDTIEDGLEMLANAKAVVGHNIMQFDLAAIRLLYPWFELHRDTEVHDTLVSSRLIFTDQKDKDFRLWRKGKLPGQLIGTDKLEAWGYRLGLQKGDYAKEYEERAKEQGITDPEEIRLFVWGSWNQDMEDYCDLDVDVNTALYKQIVVLDYPEFPIDFEHDAHSMAIIIEENGWPFDVKRAEKLADEISQESAVLEAQAIEHFGYWYAPAKKHQVRHLWDDPDGINKKKTYKEPRAEFGEDDSRAIWGEVTVPKQTRSFKSLYRVNKNTGEKSLNNNVTEGAPFCAVVRKEFKPTSRQQIIDRFTTVYNWEPIDFTEKGNPEVSDDVLRGLIGRIPMAEELAEVFYLSKRLGQIKTGANSWLNKVQEDGAIHHRLNVGGTVSGRCSHSNPNIAQVPKVMSASVLEKDGSFNPKVLGPDGEPISDCFNPDGTIKKSIILKGRVGRHGWDCRRLFYVPAGWTLVGCDLSGIELRCLASLAKPFDDGFLVNQILDGDIHTANQQAAGLETRDQAKTFIYALVYGAGDVKIGSIVDPLAPVEEQRAIGKRLKAQFFAKLPGLAAAVKLIQKQARRGFVEGLDGRRLMVRAQHAALNLRLQSDGAVIAKKWMLNADDRFLDEGLKHGWDGDYAFLGFIHDELQVAVRDEYVDFAETNLIEAAADSGRFFDFGMEVEAEAKHGINWAQTH
jgi:DNA polymerase I-like protein with 3'-5' exonuclease and polymerase domains